MAAPSGRLNREWDGDQLVFGKGLGIAFACLARKSELALAHFDA